MVKLGIVHNVWDTVTCPHGHAVEVLEYEPLSTGGLLVTLATDCAVCRDAGLYWDEPTPDLQGRPREGVEVWVDLPAEAEAR